jgi:hypothetical protein
MREYRRSSRHYKYVIKGKSFAGKFVVKSARVMRRRQNGGILLRKTPSARNAVSWVSHHEKTIIASIIN